MKVDKSSGEMQVDTYIRQEDGTIDYQDEFRMPTQFSWLRSSYCYGAEQLTHS